MAPAPVPRSQNHNVDVPITLQFTHHVLSSMGWYSKYPIGWPAVLALPEQIRLGWLVNPVLGAVLLVLIGLTAQEVFSSRSMFPAVAIAALSPYVLSNSVGRMSHALAGVLVALATLFCIQGLRSEKLSRFAWMFAAVIASFHVRPFTALVVAFVLGVGSLIGTKHRPALCFRVAVLSTAAALIAIASVLLYNWRFTGNPLLSPYALLRGVSVPPEILVTAGELIQNLKSVWRFSVQSTLLYTFPFLLLLALYGLWVGKQRNRTAPWLLLALPIALAVAHLVQFEGSGSMIGERYWYEGFFALVVLAADGLIQLVNNWQCSPGSLRAVAIGLTAAQLLITLGAALRMDEASRPGREVRTLAETYTDCDCVVYFRTSAPAFTANHLNLNSAEWQSSRAFYAIDPGTGERAKWTALFHKPRWVVLRYDPEAKVAKLDSLGAL